MTTPPFRDTEKAEASGIIIASDVLCKICQKPSPTEGEYHRTCLDIQVLQTFEKTLASNAQVVASNQALGQIFETLTHTLGAASQNKQASSTLYSAPITPPPTPPPIPEGSEVLFPFPSAEMKVEVSSAPPKPKTLMQRRREVVARRRNR